MLVYTKEPAEEDLERIADALWNNRKGEGIVFFDVFEHNACNHTMSGTIDVAGVVHGFIIESGDRNGTVVKGWGDPEDVGTYDPGPPPELRTFVPKDHTLHIARPEMFRVYCLWRKEKWFMEKERAYNYDRHFQPGGYIEDHYRKWATEKGLEPGYLSNLPKEALALINEVQQ